MRQHNHRDLTGAALRQAFVLTGAILVLEAVAGFASHSVALLADAGHILVDVIALGLAWFAIAQAHRPADSRRTYGYHRVGILTAFANGATLILVVAGVAFEAIRRLAHPVPIQGGLVIVSALVAVAVNTYISVRLRADHREANGSDLNLRAARLHVLGDLAASVGVVGAGLLVLLTGWTYADPIVSLLITGLIAWSAYRILLDTMNVLLEGVPRGMDIEEVAGSIAQVQGVTSVHDLHVWCLSGDQVALSCHLVVADGMSATDSEHLVRTIEEAICSRYGIGHTTIQVESCHPCADDLGHARGDHNHPHTLSEPAAQGKRHLHSHSH